MRSTAIGSHAKKSSSFECRCAKSGLLDCVVLGVSSPEWMPENNVRPEAVTSLLSPASERNAA
jgi:hypothetical protein